MSDVFGIFFAVTIFPICIIGIGCGDKTELGIKGEVAGENGQPIAKANVSIHGPESYSVTTDTDGQFLFTDVVASSYQITITKIGYRSYTNRVIVADKLVIADVILEKEDSQTISGMMMNKAIQKPVSNVQLTTIPLNIVVISDDNGNYQFNQKFKPANYVVKATVDVFEDNQVEVIIQPGEPS